MLTWTRNLALLSLLALSACRMPVVTQGNGFVYGENRGEVYRDGYIFNIQEDFSETFWPIPAPAHSFTRWTELCRNRYEPCTLNLDERLWSRDDELPLVARFKEGYSGPLKLYYHDLFWLEMSDTLIVPEDSIVIDGLHPGAEPRYFMATTDLSTVIPAERVGDEFRFAMPAGRTDPNDYWMFVSAVDARGRIASVGWDLDPFTQVTSAELSPQRENSPWADVLADCAAANTGFKMCDFGTLPLLAATASSPSVGDVMRRTAVTHRWMGKRFQQVLEALPPEMLKLFRGVTSVVIGSSIRPSYYSPLTGAIYLDPQDLWLTPVERDTIDKEPDFRSEFGSTLAFSPVSLYMANGAPAWYYSPAYADGEHRSLDEIVPAVGNLLIHELTHANDAIPPAGVHSLADSETPFDAMLRLEVISPSLQLRAQRPLRSNLLHDLAAVMFAGYPATEELTRVSARDVGLAFEADDANDLYAYSSEYEDTAMLVEEVLTHHFFGADRVASFLDIPPSEVDDDCSDYKVRWGVRSRVNTPGVRERAELVLGNILDEADVSSYLNAMPATYTLKRGVGLCESVSLLPDSGSARRAAPLRQFSAPRLLQRQQLRHNRHQGVRQYARLIRAQKPVAP